MISSSYDPLIVGLRNGVKSDQAIGASAAEIAQGFESLLGKAVSSSCKVRILA